MLTQLATLKSRLAIDPFDIKDDTILTNFILLVTARFENECNRKLAYAQNITEDFQAGVMECWRDGVHHSVVSSVEMSPRSRNSVSPEPLVRLSSKLKTAA